jgi:hypothetical protein
MAFHEYKNITKDCRPPGSKKCIWFFRKFKHDLCLWGSYRKLLPTKKPRKCELIHGKRGPSPHLLTYKYDGLFGERKVVKIKNVNIGEVLKEVRSWTTACLKGKEAMNRKLESDFRKEMRAL